MQAAGARAGAAGQPVAPVERVDRGRRAVLVLHPLAHGDGRLLHLWRRPAASGRVCTGRPPSGVCCFTAQVGFLRACAAPLLCCSSITSCLATRQVWMSNRHRRSTGTRSGAARHCAWAGRGRGARASGRAMKRSAAASFLVVTRSMGMGAGPTPALATAWPQNGWSPGTPAPRSTSVGAPGRQAGQRQRLGSVSGIPGCLHHAS